MGHFLLDLYIGVPGELKYDQIENPTFEQIQEAILALNGIDHRLVGVIYRSISSNKVESELLVHGGGGTEDRVLLNRYGFSNDPFQSREELVDPNSDDNRLIFVSKNTSGNSLRPYRQTVSKDFALKIIEYYFRTTTFPHDLQWTTQRDYGG